jgi:peptidoglycan/xylan/chitin deacetylase (PgdA/CDA1 family)
MSYFVWLVILVATPWLFLYALWRARFRQRSKDAIPVLAYHQVSDGFDWSITRQKVSQFERGMKSLKDKGYRVVGLKDAAISEKPGDRRSIALTFDDACLGVHRNAFPTLQRLGFTACVFVVTGYVGKPSEWDYGWGKNKRRHLSWEQIREMAQAGFEVGSHTVNHPDLTRIPKRFVEYELRASKEMLEDKLGRSVDFLSYPFGRSNRYVEQEAERLGYAGAYALRSHHLDSGTNPFSRTRWGVYLLDSPLSLRMKIEQGKFLWLEEMKGRIISAFSGWTVMLKGRPDYAHIKTKSCAA